MSKGEPFVIAVIDDDPNVRELLAVIGKRAGGVVLEAGTVAEGVRILREYPWDIAIIDRRLPDGDGLDLCRIATSGGESHRYILLVGGVQAHGENMRGFEAGADEYVGKPVDPTELAARLRAVRRTVIGQKTLL